MINGLPFTWIAVLRMEIINITYHVYGPKKTTCGGPNRILITIKLCLYHLDFFFVCLLAHGERRALLYWSPKKACFVHAQKRDKDNFKMVTKFAPNVFSATSALSTLFW